MTNRIKACETSVEEFMADTILPQCLTGGVAKLAVRLACGCVVLLDVRLVGGDSDNCTGPSAPPSPITGTPPSARAH